MNDCSCSSVSWDTHSESDYVWNCESEKDLSDQLTITDSLQSIISSNNHINVHVSPFQQRPSLISDHDNMHVLNISNDDYVHVTSMYDNMVSQQYQSSSQSYDRSYISNTFSVDSLLCSTQQAQQVSNSQITTPEVLRDSSNISDEGSQHESISLPDSQDQSTSHNTLNLGLKDKGFRIDHLNIQGLTNKIDQLKLLLQSEKNLIHILGISETKLTQIHPDMSFNIDGYQKPFRRDRTENAGGGLLVYVKNGVSCKRRTDLEHQSLECIWTEIKPKNNSPYLVGHIYRPPNSSIQWNEFFEDCIEKVLQEEKEMYLLGDINRDLLNDQIRSIWNDYVEPFGLTQVVSEPTRVTSNSRTLIDHIYCNCPENVKSVLVPKLGLSDHFPIFVTRKIHNRIPKGKHHHTISYRSFKNFDEHKFINDLQAVPWDLIKIFDDTDDILEAWTDLFLQVVNKNIPIKHHRVKRKTQPNWLSPDILDAMKTRDRHKALGNDTEYKSWGNKVNELIKQQERSISDIYRK